jgi:hypothetical protein
MEADGKRTAYVIEGKDIVGFEFESNTDVVPGTSTLARPEIEVKIRFNHRFEQVKEVL